MPSTLPAWATANEEHERWPEGVGIDSRKERAAGGPPFPVKMKGHAEVRPGERETVLTTLRQDLARHFGEK